MTPPVMSVDEVVRDAAFESAVDERARQVVQNMLLGSGLRDLIEVSGIPRDKVAGDVVLTSLPTSPVADGREILLASGQAGVNWRFRYNESGGQYRWEAIGKQAPITAEAGPQVLTGAGVYTDLTGSPGPAITVPFSGDYAVAIGASLQAQAANAIYMSYDIGATAAVDDDSILVYSSSTSNVEAHCWRERPKLALAAGTVLTAKYKSGAGYAQKRIIQITPIRVGG